MGGQRPRGLVVVLALGVAAAGWFLFEARNRTDWSTYWAAIIGLATFALALFTEVRRWFSGTGTDDGSELDGLIDRLARAVYQQWDQAAAERGLLAPDPIEVCWCAPTSAAESTAAAVRSRRFRPIPGLAAAQEGRFTRGTLGDLHGLYGGLGSGRLVIAGPAGSGKSGAAVLLVRAALEHRDAVAGRDRDNVPVPVLFTIAGWDPRIKLRSWLVSQLRQTYEGLFVGGRGIRAAEELLDAGKIAVILDGFDELPEQLRPDALWALSEQPSFRLVVLSRRQEMVDAAKAESLRGAATIVLEDVSGGQAADYLEQVRSDPSPSRWGELVRRLRGACHFFRVSHG